MENSILIVEDDENLQLVLKDNLQVANYQVEAVETGQLAQQSVERTVFDLIILDIMLPDTDGYQLCQHFRANNVKAMILMLTARSLEDDIVKGFEAGADDYLIKPYRLRELLMRVKALLRRQATTQVIDFHFSNFSVDMNSRSVSLKDNQDPQLTKKEFDLLHYFIANRNRALTRQQILDSVWGVNVVVDERTVDNFVSNLKKKLLWNSNSNYCFSSLRGVGYRFEYSDD